MTKPLSATQAAFLAILGARYLFLWNEFYSIGDRDNGYRHGHYDYDRDKAARAAKVTIATVRAMVKNGQLEKVTWFMADATGVKAGIYKRASR